MRLHGLLKIIHQLIKLIPSTRADRGRAGILTSYSSFERHETKTIRKKPTNTTLLKIRLTIIGLHTHTYVQQCAINGLACFSYVKVTNFE